MKRKFIIDKEINLYEFDFLQTKPYADSLTRIINNTEENKVFTIGLFGSWGSGKSSIIETSSKDFNQSKVKFISYDAWQYANDSFRRMFLRTVRKDLGFDETPLMKKFYENESADIGNKFSLSTTRVAWILLSAIVILMIIWLIPHTWIEYDKKFPIYSIISVLSLLITIVSGSFNQLKVSITKPLFFAPEQFESCFKEMISVSLKKYKWYENIVYTIAGDKTVKNLEKLVIVIDNIDRCNNDVAYNLLTDIKTFLGSSNYNIVFVIPVDDEALRKHLFKINNQIDEDISVKEKEEFLRKFFNVTIRLKPYQEADMFSFTKKINEKFELNFSNQTLSLAAKEYSTNPRRVIQLFNNLSSELSSYPEDFAIENETLICAVIILREEFGSYYKQVINAPVLFSNGDTSSILDEEKKKSIDRFIRITRNIFNKAEAETLNRILTNSENIFSNLSADAKDAIVSYDIEKIKELFKENQADISEYIIHNSKIQLKNGLLEDLTSYFDIVTSISSSLEINKDTNLRFGEVFFTNIDFIIQNTGNNDNMCLYALTLEKQNLQELKKAVINSIKNINNGPKFWTPLFNAVINHFQDAETSKQLHQTFFDNYKLLNDSIELSKEQYKYLLTDQFVIRSIGEISVISKEEEVFDNLINLFSNKKNINANTYEELFKRINELEININTKSHNEIIEIVSILIKLLDEIPKGVLYTTNVELKSLYNSIISVRKIPNPNYPNYRNYDNEAYFIQECLNDNKDIDLCISFVMNIYRITNNSISVLESIKLLSEKRDFLNPIFKQFIDDGFTLNPLKEFIIQDSNFESDLSLELIKHSFFITDKNKLSLDKQIAKNKIDSLLVYANNNNSIKVYQLLESLIVNEVYKNMLAEIVVTKSAEFINNQPKLILKLAVDSFKQDNYNDFKNNFTFLEVIAQNGTQVQMHYLIYILISKLDANESLTDVLSIAKNIHNIKQTDKRLIVSHLGALLENTGDTLDDAFKQRIGDLISKFE